LSLRTPQLLYAFSGALAILPLNCFWPLTWHGDNAMERINLPSLAMGGFQYEDSLILFRRLEENTFELQVYP
jgi:hypothetical protein